MNLTIARQMIGAEFLKLRKRRGLVAWALVLACGSLLIFLGYRALRHASNPLNDPAGGVHGFQQDLEMLGFFMAPLAAIMIGAEAGSSDRANGVFRDLVVTGRSRFALFLVRVPGALMLTVLVTALAFGIAVAGTFIFAAGTPTPSAAYIAKAAAWVLLANGTLCVVATGLASLIGSRTATVTALIGWQLVASPILLQSSSLGKARDTLLDGAFSQIKPGPRGGEPVVGMSIAAVIVCVALWLAVTAALGAWRTVRQDA
jgi:ABC-type transport system involved in multi-copper enzyme maturation permease subunit